MRATRCWKRFSSVAGITGSRSQCCPWNSPCPDLFLPCKGISPPSLRDEAGTRSPARRDRGADLYWFIFILSVCINILLKKEAKETCRNPSYEKPVTVQ